ncbi:MAG: ImmA/IrrE family metallo-endopeptidase [Thermoguttaceae bacterium]
MDKIVELTGGTVEMADDPSQQEADGGSLIIEGESDYTIYLSPYTTPLRDNFTIAHELGHFFLHFFLQEPRPEVPRGFTRYGTGPIEWQANRFAAALLMPADLFREKHKAFQHDAFRLAGFFEVSHAAVEVRGESLGCPVQ